MGFKSKFRFLDIFLIRNYFQHMFNAILIVNFSQLLNTFVYVIPRIGRTGKHNTITYCSFLILKIKYYKK